MGTEYRIINKTRKEVYGFGLGWNPKYTEAICNKDSARFLLFIMLEVFRKEQIYIINEGNSWDWNYEINIDDYTDKTEEMQKRFIDWKRDSNLD